MVLCPKMFPDNALPYALFHFLVRRNARIFLSLWKFGRDSANCYDLRGMTRKIIDAMCLPSKWKSHECRWTGFCCAHGLPSSSTWSTKFNLLKCPWLPHQTFSWISHAEGHFLTPFRVVDEKINEFYTCKVTNLVKTRHFTYWTT